MTFATTFVSWQTNPPPAIHQWCSPNLMLMLTDMADRWDFLSSMGCFGIRPVRDGTLPSSHSYGAAIDIGYPAHRDDLVAAEVVPFLVARSHELHVQAIHDYRRRRIWRAGRTGKPEEACRAWWRVQRSSQATGMGQVWANHLHVETTPEGWGDTTPILDRWGE